MRSLFQYLVFAVISFVFEYPVFAGPTLIFSEVLYNPHGSSEANNEWVELFNAGSSTIDLDGYYFEDESGGRFTFQAGDQISVSQAITVSRTMSGFVGDFGPFSFVLNNGGDILRLFDNLDQQIDMVAWGGKAGWSISAGDGESLKRLSTASGPDAWQKEQSPTPGDANGLSTVPEPATLFMLALGAGSLGLMHRKRKRKI